MKVSCACKFPIKVLGGREMEIEKRQTGNGKNVVVEWISAAVSRRVHQPMPDCQLPIR